MQISRALVFETPRANFIFLEFVFHNQFGQRGVLYIL